MMHKVERDEKNFQFYPSDDIFVVASLLKVCLFSASIELDWLWPQQYLRDLPDPVFKFALEDRVKHSEGLGKSYLTYISLSAEAQSPRWARPE